MHSDWGMSRALRLEQFSRAYLRAIAAVAGLAIYEPEVDDDSIDLGLAARGGRGTLRSPRLEVQIKATGRDLLREEGIPFPLKVKNFDDLRGKDFIVPRILAVLLVPTEIEEWLQQSDEEMALRRCLSGIAKPSPNSARSISSPTCGPAAGGRGNVPAADTQSGLKD